MEGMLWDLIHFYSSFWASCTNAFRGIPLNVGSRYLDHLIVERKYAEAASLCPKLLRGSASAWERWVFHFAHLRQLPVLVPYMPTENPRLRDTAYEVALVALATSPSFHKDLLSTVKSWPPVIYSALPVISAIEPQLNTSSMTDTLKEALAEFYVIDTQYEKAFALYADLMKPDIFDFIEKHNLHDAIREKPSLYSGGFFGSFDQVVQLMMLDCKRAVPLLILHRDFITPSEVVSQLLDASKKCDSRYFLHLYLHALFEVSQHAGKDFHDMQVCVSTMNSAFLIDDLEELALEFGCKVGVLLSSYLGLLLGAPFKFVLAWDGVMWKRWRARLRLELWGGGALERKPHLVKWTNVCLGKRKSGLGLGMDEGFDFRRTSGLVTSCYVIYSLLFLLLMILRRLEWKMFKTGRKKEVVGPCFSRLLNDWEVDLVEWFLLSLHRKRVSSKAGDKVIWIRSKNGKFFVKALYIALELGCTTLFPACVIWNSWVSLKWVFPYSIRGTLLDMTVISFLGFGKSPRGRVLQRGAALLTFWILWLERNGKIPR
ncbi:Vacuolar protein sorting-associated protein 41-like [Vitis vinifera]|uniref:Vacuolar protein sorting-associated protein 41-like n=1 Tax=Vitis vinifera TaxID=29760 RepID=A0A438F311_VITVI|nr:Vacuolar protein sorting-associated protein 41-like [Vitis vinifera]